MSEQGSTEAAAHTGMLGKRLLGVYTAAKGITHFVASSLLDGQMFHVSRMPSSSSSWAKSMLREHCA